MRRSATVNRLTILLAFLLVLSSVLLASGCTQSDLNAPDPDKVQSKTATTEAPKEQTTITDGTTESTLDRSEGTTSDTSASEAASGEGQSAEVTRVIDGDTIDVLIDGHKYRVRFIGIDTPERGRPYYREATNKTKELLLGKRVRLVKDVSETDRYGRLLRYVYVDGTFVNAELVKQGYAVQATFPPDVKYAELFKQLAAEAREKGAGLWKTGR